MAVILYFIANRLWIYRHDRWAILVVYPVDFIYIFRVPDLAARGDQHRVGRDEGSWRSRSVSWFPPSPTASPIRWPFQPLKIQEWRLDQGRDRGQAEQCKGRQIYPVHADTSG